MPIAIVVSIAYHVRMTKTIIERAIEASGGAASLARKLGIKPPSIYSWREIPHKRLTQIEAITGIPREELRPDLFEGVNVSREPSAPSVNSSIGQQP